MPQRYHMSSVLPLVWLINHSDSNIKTNVFSSQDAFLIGVLKGNNYDNRCCFLWLSPDPQRWGGKESSLAKHSIFLFCARHAAICVSETDCDPLRIEWGRKERRVKGRVQTKGDWRILSVTTGGDIVQLSDKLSSLCQMNSAGENDFLNKEMSNVSLAVRNLYLIQFSMILRSGPDPFKSLWIFIERFWYSLWMCKSNEKTDVPLIVWHIIVQNLSQFFFPISFKKHYFCIIYILFKI